MPLKYGLKISTPSSDVKTQSDANLAFTSKYPSLKLIASSDLSVTTNGSGDGTNSVAHNLGFRPAFFVFQKCTAQWTTLDVSSYTNAFVSDPGTVNHWGGSYHHTLHVYTDTTSIYLQAKGAAASTTYTIHYLLFADLAESYTGADIGTDKHYGFKVSRDGVDVRSAKQYQLEYSSRYKPIQYYDVNYKVVTMTLPPVWASPLDTPADEGTYVDISHGLGYAPFFLAFFRSSYTNPTISIGVPFLSESSIDTFAYEVGSFCDATRVRLSFWRGSIFSLGQPQPKFDWEETVTVKVYIFTEDLSQSFSAG